MHTAKSFLWLITILSVLFLGSIKTEGENRNIEDDFAVEKSPLSDRFLIRYEGLAASGAAFDVLSILDEAYYDIGNDLGYFPEKSIEVIIYTSKKHELPSVMPDWATGLYDGRIHLKIGDIKKGRKHLKYIVYHEYTHALLRQWVKQDIPIWLNEGLATYEGFISGEYTWKVSLKCKYFSLAELNRPFYKLQKTEDALCAYRLCKEIISYLVKQYGKYRLKKLLAALSEGKDIDSAFSSVYYMNLSQFEKKWKQYSKILPKKPQQLNFFNQ